MAMAFDEFAVALNKSARSEGVNLAQDRDVHRDYEAYLALVELTGDDGTVTFYQDGEGQTRLGFRPTPAPGQ